MNRIRVAFDAQLVIPPRTGLGVYAHGLLSALAEAASSDVEVVPFAAALRNVAAKRRIIACGKLVPRIRRFPERFLAPLRPFVKLGPAVEWFVEDASVVHFPNVLGRPVRSAAVVRTVHDVSFLLEPRWFSRRVARQYASATFEAARRSDFILADSNATQEDLLHGVRVPPERVRVAYPGLREGFPGPPDPEGRARLAKRYGVPPDRNFVLHVGTIEPRKNLTRLVEAFAASRFARQGGFLVLAGADGGDLAAVRSTARRTSCADRIVCTGAVRDEDLPALYRAARLFACPSHYEGFGLALLEALACGVPSLTSGNGALREVAGDAAWIVPVEDPADLREALDRLNEDETLRTRLAERGPRRAAAFRWSTTAKTVLSVYREAAGRG